MRAVLISFFDQLDTVGLKYIHYSLINAGHDSSILYLSHFSPDNKRQMENIEDFLLQGNVGFIGVSVMSEEYYSACHLTKYIKGFVKSIPIIWGGIHPTISPESCLDYADYVCVGEGENVVRDIADAVAKNEDIGNIKNLCYLEQGKIKRNPLYPRIDDLDSLPRYEHIPRNSFLLTDRRLVPLDRKVFRKYARNLGKTYSIMSSRGCPFSCTYCCNNFISRLYGSSKIRRRSIPNIIEELEIALRDNPEIEYVIFHDDCLLACGEDYLKELFRIYKEKISKPFLARTIPIYLTPEKIRSLKDAGLGWIVLGLQSGSDRTCKEVYKRSSSSKDFLKAAGMVKDFCLAAFYDIILDNPFETEEDELETLNTVMEIPKPYYAELFSLTFYPGTEIYERAKSECPQHLEGQLDKNYLLPSKKLINDMIRLATLLDKRYMAGIVGLYKRHSKERWFRLFFAVVNFFSIVVLQPVAYFQVIRLSQGGSTLRALKVLPLYCREGLTRYISQLIKA